MAKARLRRSKQVHGAERARFGEPTGANWHCLKCEAVHYLERAKCRKCSYHLYPNFQDMVTEGEAQGDEDAVFETFRRRNLDKGECWERIYSEKASLVCRHKGKHKNDGAVPMNAFLDNMWWELRYRRHDLPKWEDTLRPQGATEMRNIHNSEPGS